MYQAKAKNNIDGSDTGLLATKVPKQVVAKAAVG